MNVSIALPDQVAQTLLGQWQDLPRRTLEALALEAHRSQIITAPEVQQMLNFSSRWETDAFLKTHQVYLDYTDTDLQQDIKTLHQLVG